MGRHKTYPYIRRILCRGNPRGCPIVDRFSKIDSAVSRYEYRPTQAQETDNCPGRFKHKERSSPFPTNDSVLCPGKGFVVTNDLGHYNYCKMSTRPSHRGRCKSGKKSLSARSGLTKSLQTLPLNGLDMAIQAKQVWQLAT